MAYRYDPPWCTAAAAAATACSELVTGTAVHTYLLHTPAAAVSPGAVSAMTIPDDSKRLSALCTPVQRPWWRAGWCRRHPWHDCSLCLPSSGRPFSPQRAVSAAFLRPGRSPHPCSVRSLADADRGLGTLGHRHLSATLVGVRLLTRVVLHHIFAHALLARVLLLAAVRVEPRVSVDAPLRLSSQTSNGRSEQRRWELHVR
jgi:hypothetical protein